MQVCTVPIRYGFSTVLVMLDGVSKLVILILIGYEFCTLNFNSVCLLEKATYFYIIIDQSIKPSTKALHNAFKRRSERGSYYNLGDRS